MGLPCDVDYRDKWPRDYTVAMANIAGLYRVRGPNGTYYAVYDPASGRMWTERSEQSARAQASEAGLELAPERSISHHALMQMSGRDTGGGGGPKMPAAPQPAPSQKDGEDQPDRPIISRAPFAAADPGPSVLTNRSGQVGGGIFSGDTPVAPPTEGAAEDAETPSAGAVFNRDVLDEKRPMLRGKGKNPFADRKPRRRD
jgi:hypothetical protein